MIAVDVQKAFDCVYHYILCKKSGIMGRDSSWFKSYLLNIPLIVSVNGTNSKVHELIFGIPQGSLLEPLLYLYSCSDMEMAVNCKLNLYADDSIIVVSDKDP